MPFTSRQFNSGSIQKSPARPVFSRIDAAVETLRRSGGSDLRAVDLAQEIQRDSTFCRRRIAACRTAQAEETRSWWALVMALDGELVGGTSKLGWLRRPNASRSIHRVLAAARWARNGAMP
jgi:hypothetical protein